MRLSATFVIALASFAALQAESARAQEQEIPVQAMVPELNALLPDAIRSKGKITLVTDAHALPCEAFNEDNTKIIGFEPDMIRAVTQKLGVEVEMTSTDFPAVIPGLQSARYDMAMSCLSDRAERQETMLFVDYWTSMAAIYTMESNTKITDDPLSLCGLKTATQSGIIFIDYINNILSAHCEKNGRPRIELGEMPNRAAVLQALYSDRIDFALSDAAAYSNLRSVAPKPIRRIENPYLPRGYIGFAVRKEDTQLAEALLAATTAVVDEGLYDVIVKKWELGALKLDKPGINLATVAPFKNPTP